MPSSTKDLALSLLHSELTDPGPEPCLPYFQEFATNPVTVTERTQQLPASLLWLLSARIYNHTSLLSAYTHLAQLLGRLPILGLDIWVRKEILDRIPTDLAISAARCALNLKDAELALTLVDKYRGLSWGQILRTLPPLEETERLIKDYPSLGVPLRGLLRALFTSSMSHRAKSLHADRGAAQQEIDACIEIATSVDELLMRIREMPGYQQFLEPDPLKNVRRLAKYGHVVMIIPDEACTHLVFLRKGEDEVSVSAVQGLGLEEAHMMVQNMKSVLGQAGLSTRGVHLDKLDAVQAEESTERGFTTHPRMSLLQYVIKKIESILSTLWNTVGLAIKEIFQLELNGGFKVYIYPTGPLSNLPIHAAGNRDESLLDYATPSYITSLQYLPFPPDTITRDPPHVFVISQPNTPGHTPLPYTTIEVAEIKKFVPPERIQLYEQEQGNKTALLNQSYELARTKPLILHLACHAKQYPSDPFQSAFFLHDGHVTLSSLLWSQNERPVLAVLSACETAAADEARPDEFLHIGASMHCLKGFPSVVATLWAISDSDGPRMAGSLYKGVFETGLDSAASLRMAINSMRSEKVPLVRWVPFVHFGV
ncbi:CHAT domain-containing protein [Rhizoctonia solani]|nr:CHAT domain-containing protein [Rhizoctonia solani]